MSKIIRFTCGGRGYGKTLRRKTMSRLVNVLKKRIDFLNEHNLEYFFVTRPYGPNSIQVQWGTQWEEKDFLKELLK